MQTLLKILLNAQIWCPASCCLDHHLPASSFLDTTLAVPAASTASQMPCPLAFLPSESTSPLQDFTLHLERSVSCHPGLCGTTWNMRSLSVKFAFVAHSLHERELDILSVMESWHQEPEDVLILHVAPPGFSFCNRPRVSVLYGLPAHMGASCSTFAPRFVLLKLLSRWK